VLPADDERVLWREIAQSHLDRIAVVFFVRGHGDDGIWITGEYAGTADAVESFLAGLVTFGIMAAENDGGFDFEGESFEHIHEVRHIVGGIFIARTQEFV
jgi:hypothetical protein